MLLITVSNSYIIKVARPLCLSGALGKSWINSAAVKRVFARFGHLMSTVMLSLCVVFRLGLSQAVSLSFNPAPQLHHCASWMISAWRWPGCGGIHQRCCSTHNPRRWCEGAEEPWFQHLYSVSRSGFFWTPLGGTDVDYEPGRPTHMTLFSFPLLATWICQPSSSLLIGETSWVKMTKSGIYSS